VSDSRRFGAIVALALVVTSCTSTPPTPTLAPNRTPPTATPSAVVSASPSVVSPAASGGLLPATVLGMPVMSVANAYALAGSGKLDGRVAAVGGYWAMYFYPCPSAAHAAVLAGFCYGAQFADNPGSINPVGGPEDGAPLIVPETQGAPALWNTDPQRPNPVVLIVHAGDSRAFQCMPVQVTSCEQRLVIDRLAWLEGADVPLSSPRSDLSFDRVNLTVDAAAAAALQPGEQLLTAYPAEGSDLADIDPRFDIPATDIVWYVRAVRGSADSKGTFEGVDRLVNDADGAMTAELGMDTGDYVPGRIVLTVDQTSHGYQGNGNSLYPWVEVAHAGTVIFTDRLGMSTTPLTVRPGSYVVRAFVGTEFGPASNAPDCSTEIVVAAGGNDTYVAAFDRRTCSWSVAPETTF
jgi:hypothetical protein